MVCTVASALTHEVEIVRLSSESAPAERQLHAILNIVLPVLWPDVHKRMNR